MSTPSDSHPVRTGVISTVVGTIAVAALADVWPPVKTTLLWCWVQVKWVFGLFTGDYLAPGWALAILAVLALITASRWISTALRRDSEDKADFQSYTTDNLHGAKWRWRWNGHDVTNLWCFCPACDSELVYDDSSCSDILRMSEPRTDFICEHCGNTHVTSIKGGNQRYAVSAIQREIQRKLRTGQIPTGERTEVPHMNSATNSKN